MPVEQMNISLPPRMASFIRGKVKAGEYTNASEVVRDALRHMQIAEETRKSRRALEAFEPEDDASLAGVQEGLSQLEGGEYLELDGPRALKDYIADAIVRGRARSERKGKTRQK